MILEQYYLGCLAHASYLIADQVSRQAVVIDPQRDIKQYLLDAKQLDCTIGHVILTHMHADFIAGHLELRDRVGATIHLGAQASAEYAFTPMGDGDELRLGGVRLSVDSRVRPRAQRRPPVRGPDRRHAVHRRCRPP
jgi:glyoxylase-like metal-dependent hydrolase (beta-lactamase superfamily II)